MSAPQPQTVLQFHLRGLFVITGLAAVVCGALASTLQWDQRRLVVLAGAGGGLLLGCGGLTALTCWARWRIERNAGPLRRRVRSAPRSLARFYCFWGLCTLAAAAGVALTLWGGLAEWTRVMTPLNTIAVMLPSSALLALPLGPAAERTAGGRPQRANLQRSSGQGRTARLGAASDGVWRDASGK